VQPPFPNTVNFYTAKSNLCEAIWPANLTEYRQHPNWHEDAAINWVKVQAEVIYPRAGRGHSAARRVSVVNVVHGSEPTEEIRERSMDIDSLPAIIQEEAVREALPVELFPSKEAAIEKGFYHNDGYEWIQSGKYYNHTKAEKTSAIYFKCGCCDRLDCKATKVEYWDKDIRQKENGDAVMITRTLGEEEHSHPPPYTDASKEDNISRGAPETGNGLTYSRKSRRITSIAVVIRAQHVDTVAGGAVAGGGDGQGQPRQQNISQFFEKGSNVAVGTSTGGSDAGRTGGRGGGRIGGRGQSGQQSNRQIFPQQYQTSDELHPDNIKKITAGRTAGRTGGRGGGRIGGRGGGRIGGRGQPGQQSNRQNDDSSADESSADDSSADDSSTSQDSEGYVSDESVDLLRPNKKNKKKAAGSDSDDNFVSK